MPKYKLIAEVEGMRPLTFISEDKNSLLCCSGYKLYIYSLRDKNFKFITSYRPDRSILDFVGRLFPRVFRYGFTSACEFTNGEILLSDGKFFYKHQLILKSSIEKLQCAFKPPMNLTIDRKLSIHYMGEYLQYGEPNAPYVYSYSPSVGFQEIYKFPVNEIDHIHGVFVDKDSKLKILTGDFSVGVGVYNYDLKESIASRWLLAGQQGRLCWLFSSGDSYLSATDTQVDSNFLIKFASDGSVDQLIGELPGSSIYYHHYDDEVVFSTTVEPGKPKFGNILDLLDWTIGPGIKDRSARIYSYKLWDGNAVELICVEKDIIPARLGQFGTFTFPGGRGPADVLVSYGIGVKRFHDSVLIFDRDVTND